MRHYNNIMSAKKCTGCKKEKKMDNYYFRKDQNRYNSQCIPCENLYAKKRRHQKKNNSNSKLKETRKKYYEKNKDKFNQISKEYHKKNADKIKIGRKQYYEDNKEMFKKKASEQRQKIKEKIANKEVEKPDIKVRKCTGCKQEKDVTLFTFRKTRNIYDSKCKPCNKEREAKRRAQKGPEINKRRREIQKPLTVGQKILNALRARLNKIVKNRKEKNLYIKLLGCDKSFLMEWFEYIFNLKKKLNFNWDNYGKFWQIDHVTPCASFDLMDESQIKICFHWTNLCPVTKKYNLQKQAKIIPNDQQKQILNVAMFLINLDKNKNYNYSVNL